MRVPPGLRSCARLLAALGVSITLVQGSVEAQTVPSPEPSPAQSSAPTMDPNSAFADPSQPIKVHLNKMFMIALESNPSTGYHWVQHGDLDKTVLKYLSSFFLAPQTNAVGAPGHEIRMYWAEGLGDTTIDLDYVAPGTSGTIGKPWSSALPSCLSTYDTARGHAGSVRVPRNVEDRRSLERRSKTKRNQGRRTQDRRGPRF
jgi:predicted secreted protein